VDPATKLLSTPVTADRTRQQINVSSATDVTPRGQASVRSYQDQHETIKQSWKLQTDHHRYCVISAEV